MPGPARWRLANQSSRCHTANAMTDESTAPDIFADSITLAAGPFGFALSLHLSDPSHPIKAGDRPTEADLGRLVGRIRIAPELAAAFLPSLITAVEAHQRQVDAAKETSK